MEDGAGAGELKREKREEKRLHQDTNKLISSGIQHYETSNRSGEKPFADIVLFPFLKGGP
jgi:hypothetical protein